MDRNMSLGADSIDWADPAFSAPEFNDSMLAESPWGNSALNDFTNLADYSDSPAALGLRTPSKSGPDAASGLQQPPGLQKQESSRSTGSSSADSASDSSSGRKRKQASESPMPYQAPGNFAVRKEETPMEVKHYQNVGAFQQTLTQPMPNLTVHQPMPDNDGVFDFNSAASSPNLPRDFNQQMSLDTKKKFMPSTVVPPFSQDSPVQTINPGMFTMGSSRDQSPATATAMFNTASPNAIFSTPSSDSNEPFNTNQAWGGSVAQNPQWPADFTSQFTSPGSLNFTPSPVPNGGAPSTASRQSTLRAGRSPLHIAPISQKSRVETQINVVMTLEKPPPSAEHLHLPLHTIAKSKLLAKEEYDSSKVLELHTMLVCSSAMRNPQLKEKAMQRAAAQNNEEIQRRGELQRESGEEEKNSLKDVEDSDKPVNGGEVRICNNCIARERKRAGRKKLKKEEEQQHWERYETERVVVFNSNEFLPFKPFEQREQPQKEVGMATEEPYDPPPGAISVSAAMRIACYCRHQNEKEGFQVIFTLKDHHGNVVAQEISDSILITDDHKTHPPTLTPLSNEMLFHPGQIPPNGLQTSYSMMDLPSHTTPFTSSRSAGNLQALAYGQQLQFNPHSHVHQLSASSAGFASQATSTTMTPTNLSRPGSPTSGGQSGPNKKKRKSSSSFHNRMPSGLQMTPRVDTNPSQPPSATLPPGLQMTNFSPTRGTLSAQSDQSYMTIPTNNGPAQFYGSGPSTPANENPQYAFQPSQLDIARAQSAAYFSHPSSAVPSRSNSPILQHTRQTMSAYPRAPIQTSTNQLTRQQQILAGQAAAGAMNSESEQTVTPTITKITPTEGPTAGGTEVSVFGYNFTHATQIMFGDSVAPTTFYGAQSILAISPPGRKGGVRIKIVPTNVNMQFSTQSNNPIFTYTDTNPQMMEMALKFLSQQQTGDPSRWMQYTNEVANQFMQTSISPAGIGPGYNGGNLMAYEPGDMEDVVLKVFDLVDVSESPIQPRYDLRSPSGQTMLSLATASGMHRVTAALLARGANPDVRDEGGYTPLMHAALHERLKTFQLLLIKGADPTIRSLTGYAAMDLVPGHAGEYFLQILQNTQRSRNPRPSLRSFHSHSSSKVSWDISSASFYSSDVDSSEHAVSAPPSRRPSANISLPPMPDEAPAPLQLTSSAAMMAWRDALAAQIYQFQRTVHSSMSNFQLPALPPLPDCHDNAMVRRLSSLVPARYSTKTVQDDGVERQNSQSSFWDIFSSTPGTAPPPAYSDLFPEKTESARGPATKKSSLQTAIVDAVADEKCAMLFEEPSEMESSSTATSEAAEEAKQTGGVLVPLWLGMACLLLVCSMAVMQSVVLQQTYISMQACFREKLLSDFGGLIDRQ